MQIIKPHTFDARKPGNNMGLDEMTGLRQLGDVAFFVVFNFFQVRIFCVSFDFCKHSNLKM